MQASTAVGYGTDPMRGYPVTFHITPVPGRGMFVVERADGRLADDLAWRLAPKDAQVLSGPQAADLVSRLTHRT